jgi:hypothetical protein
MSSKEAKPTCGHKTALMAMGLHVPKEDTVPHSQKAILFQELESHRAHMEVRTELSKGEDYDSGYCPYVLSRW